MSGYLPVIELECFNSLSIVARKAIIMKMLEALAEANYHWLCEHGAPNLYDWAGGKRKYAIKPRPFSLDSWQDIPTTIAKGFGDCKDFVRGASRSCTRPDTP